MALAAAHGPARLVEERKEMASNLGAEPQSRPAPMLGGGFYNRHARVQANGGAFGLPLLAHAFESMKLHDRPLVIADFGCAQGRNSMVPIGSAVREIRARIGPEVPISVVHTDQPENDFRSLFTLLRDSEESYFRSDALLFPAAIGRSFYEQIFPPASIMFGWSAFAVHWMSSSPVSCAGHVWTRLTQPEIRQRFADRSAADWRLFLSYRARELRSGGNLVVVQPCVTEEQGSAFPTLMRWVQAELETLAAEGILRAAELARMTILQYERHPSEARAPFIGGEFMGLRIREDSVNSFPDPFWSEYLAEGDRDALAERYVHFFQAPFQPSLLAALDSDRDADFRHVFASRLEAGLRQRIVSEPICLLTPLAVHAMRLEKS
jgi:hypothetical protein